MKILVVGGAGYIGSHMLKMLAGTGHRVVVLDNLSTGHRSAVRSAVFVEGDVAERARLDDLFAAHGFGAVMHFAAFSQVAESMRDPGRYYANNVAGTAALLDAMVRHRVNRLIFSSTAAVYGEPRYTPIGERHPREPVNPYGRSKWMIKQMIGDYERAHGLRYVSLRYFNAAGADPEGELGESHQPETHLIPLAMQVAAGRRSMLEVFGRDYPTEDGTCVRDYVHVEDLCRAHLLALEHLVDGGASGTFNLGNGSGFSVQQVIDAVERITGRQVRVVNRPRRPGDPACLVADARQARSALGWEPRHPQLDDIVRHAWQWERRSPAMQVA